MTDEYNDKMEVFDDGDFSVFETRYGTYSSIDREGKALVSGISKEAVIIWSRQVLQTLKLVTRSSCSVL